MNQTRTGYSKRDDRDIILGQAGQDELNLLIQDFKGNQCAPRAWSFGEFEDGEMRGSTWRRSTALVLDYVADEDVAGSVAKIADAMDKTQLGHFLIDACDRYKVRTIAVVIPLAEHVSKDRYARLVYVLLEELRAKGLSLHLVKGTSAMTHQIHLHPNSEAAWRPGQTLNPTAKIKATALAAQNMDRDRFTIGQAARAQIEKPVLTATGDDLFQW
jgi:hypothetical protein